MLVLILYDVFFAYLQPLGCTRHLRGRYSHCVQNHYIISGKERQTTGIWSHMVPYYDTPRYMLTSHIIYIYIYIICVYVYVIFDIFVPLERLWVSKDGCCIIERQRVYGACRLTSLLPEEMLGKRWLNRNPVQFHLVCRAM